MSADETEMMAATWLACEDRGLTDEETAALNLWLDASTLNCVAYLRLKAAWRRADRLSAPNMRATFIPSATSIAVPRLLTAIAAAVLLLLAGGGGWWLWLRGDELVYSTAVGKRLSMQLADGTKVDLNTNTRLRIELTAARRTARLDSGEAYFDVVHDANRPFLVYVGEQRIVDVGTKFSVFRNGDTVRVIVQEGRVQMDGLGHHAGKRPVVAQENQIVVTSGSETLVSAKSDAEINSDLAWRAGVLVFDQQSLVSAADQFNRYNNRKIIVEGNARRIRIGGRFKANNVDVFLLLLHRGFGLSVNVQGEKIIVSR